MPCYNAQATVDGAIESIVGQSLIDFELVIVDDGSTDATVECLDRWAQADQRIRILRLPHGGIIPALNAGLEQCRAPFIARMDADDRSHRERLSKQRKHLITRPELAAVGCHVAAFPGEQVREGFRLYVEWLNGLDTPERIARDIYVESPLVHPSVMIRREWLDEVGGYEDHGWAEDYDLWLRLHLAGATFGKVPETLFEWRERPERLTRTDGRYSVENFLRAKAHYLCKGPLANRDAVILWGAGQMGRRLSKHLQRGGAPLVAFVDIDPKKIGRVKRGLPVVEPESLPTWLSKFNNPAVLAAVGSRGARDLIRKRLDGQGLAEGLDYWAVA